MRPIIGALSGIFQYLMFSGHPTLSIYPRLVDGDLWQGAFAALMLVIDLVLSTRYPYTSAFSTLALYIAEAASSSPALRLVIPLPELPAPDTALGVATVLLLVASSAEGIYGLYLASTAAPAAAVVLLKDVAPRLDYQAALFLLGLFLVVYVTKSFRG